MADLTALIRLHKHELDEKRIALGELYSVMALLERQRRELDRAFEKEKEMLAGTGDVHFTFANYVENVKRQRKEMDVRKAKMEEQISVAKDSMMETFSELKKYEMTQQERNRLEKEEQLLKESQEMDAIGIEGFRRKGDE
ncbi:MAG: hypothetical protein KAS59_05290 [Alphaproteobacteria bacterium]|nr:hypothetical protein [Alphaproteobacteria bacterium]